MNLRKRIAGWLFRPEYDRLTEVIRDASNDWMMIPYMQARQPDLLGTLAEFDSRLYDILVRNLRDYQVISDSGYSDQYRLSVVNQSRSMNLTDPVASFAVSLYTDYAFPARPNLTASRDGKPDQQAQAVWDEFFDAARNNPILGDRNLHYNSQTVLVDGEIFFVFFAARIDGEVTVRTIPTEQIKEIVTMPGDTAVPLFYRRDWNDPTAGATTVYYPDWHATPDQLNMATLPTGAVRADTMKADTDVCVLHGPFKKYNGRGWPLGTAGIDWENEYSNFAKNRAAVARAAATYVEKIKAKGGQRAIDAIRSSIASSITTGADSYERNPPPVAGSTWIENDALDRQWMNRPTGATDAEKDGRLLITHAALAFGLYPHFVGHGEYFRLATASAMEGPILRKFNRYRDFWASVWRDMFTIVTDYAAEYGSMNTDGLTANVASDMILGVDPAQMTANVSSLNEMFDRGLIEAGAAARLADLLLRTALTSTGLQGVDEALDTTTQEAATSANPFDLLAETEEQYRANLRGACYGLWAGKISRGDWVDMMQIAIDAGIRDAWATGLADVGLTKEDMTEEEATALSDFVLEQYGYLGGFGDFIEATSKAAGGALAAVVSRMGLWVNRWQQARARAMMLAKSNPPLVWIYGDTDHCDDCLYANGRVYRASVWRKWGWEPKSKDLECNGYKCQCKLGPVAKGTRLTRGHPRRLA